MWAAQKVETWEWMWEEPSGGKLERTKGFELEFEMDLCLGGKWELEKGEL